MHFVLLHFLCSHSSKFRSCILQRFAGKSVAPDTLRQQLPLYSKIPINREHSASANGIILARTLMFFIFGRIVANR